MLVTCGVSERAAAVGVVSVNANGRGEGSFGKLAHTPNAPRRARPAPDGVACAAAEPGACLRRLARVHLRGPIITLVSLDSGAQPWVAIAIVGCQRGPFQPMPQGQPNPVLGQGGPPYQPANTMALSNAYQGGAQRALQAQESAQSRLGCPTLCDAGGRANFPLQSCRVSVDVHMASMFVKLVCSWSVNTNTTGLFKRAPAAVSSPPPVSLPSSKPACCCAVPTSHKATITNCRISIGTRLMRTAVIDTNEAGQYSSGSSSNSSPADEHSELADCGKYDPACFRMPIPNLHPGELVELEISYFETLDYREGQYVISVPLAFDGLSLTGRRMESLVDVECKINAGCPSCTLGSCTFPYKRLDSEGPGKVHVQADKAKPWMSNPFEIKYSVGAQDILTNCLNDSDSQCFSMVVAPPPADKVKVLYNKHIIFLIDRSGSMHGQPIANAKAALKEAVTSLNDGDFFNIVGFDHEQTPWKGAPSIASMANKQQAHNWIDGIQARGTTDIMTPLQTSVTALENMPVNTDAGMCLPFVFLLTDGAVQNEREICQYLEQSRRRTRVMTLGIGQYCNYYFLQMMALMGRGFCELALQPDTIYQQVRAAPSDFAVMEIRFAQKSIC